MMIDYHLCLIPIQYVILYQDVLNFADTVRTAGIGMSTLDTKCFFYKNTSAS